MSHWMIRYFNYFCMVLVCMVFTVFYLTKEDNLKKIFIFIMFVLVTGLPTGMFFYNLLN